ncbi:unnamed protein product [Miscanthus lutarioriparius]|uniref:C2H2-type domain-containing protein n=1 Tax=Miscanthus lutarioriparius TaxID=422564 RepID=A0A811QBE5_9POAL|nr:unnamed protein product [Miscanthus lutarioriparius]
MEAAALHRGSPCASRHELSGSGSHGLSGFGSHELSRSGHRLEGKAEAPAEQCGSPPRCSREVARLRLAGLSTIAVVDDHPYTCVDCSMTFGQEMVLCGHMRSHKHDHLTSDSEEDAPTPKRRRKKQMSKMRTVKSLDETWGNHAAATAVTLHDNNEVTENDRNGDDIPMIVIDDDDDDANPVIAVAGSRGASGPAPDATAALAMAPAPAVAVATSMLAAHASATFVNTEGAPAAASTTAVTIPLAVAAATITRAALATAVSAGTQTAPGLVKGNNGSGQAGARSKYDTNGKAVARNNNSCGKYLAGCGNVDNGKGVAGYSEAGYGGKGVAGCSSGSHTYSTSTAAGGESNKGCGNVYSCCKCKNTLFSTPQALGGHTSSHHKIMEKKGKSNLDMQSGPHKCKVCNHERQTEQELSSHMMIVHPHHAVVAAASAKEKPFQATGINSIDAALDGPYNTMGWQILAGAPRSAILAHLSSMAPVHQPPQGTMAMASNPMTEIAVVPGNAIASSSSTPRSGIATAIDAPANTMGRCLPFFLTGRSAIHAPPVSMPVHQPTQGMAAMAGNPVTGHFPAAMASNWYSFPATTSSVLPAIPLQTQEENPPQARVVPANGEHPSTHLIGSKTFSTFLSQFFRTELADPSQNQAENPPEQTVPGNNGGRTVLLFGTRIAKGQKEVKD